MDHKFTERLGEWLRTPATERDWAEGATMLLQLSGNRIMYRAISARLDAHHCLIENDLQKYYDFRVQALTHEQVAAMNEQVEHIEKEVLSLTVASEKTPRGRRPDHDSLPEEIRALIDENFKIVARMREVHLRLRSLSLDNAPCPDSDRYPYVKELISLDKQRLANWAKYDAYKPGDPVETPAPKKTRKTAKKAAK